MIKQRGLILLSYVLLLTLSLACGPGIIQRLSDKQQATEVPLSLTQLPQSTETVVETPAPAATIELSLTPPSSWHKFAAGGVELWLPESYEGCNPKENLETVIQRVKTLGPNFEKAAQMLEQNPSAITFWAFDSKVGDSGFVTNVTITSEKIFSSMKIKTYLDSVLKNLPPEAQVVKRNDNFELNRYYAGQVVIEMSLPSVGLSKQMIYTIKHGDRMWLVAYTTSSQEFDQRLPTFDQSIYTFAIQEE